MDYEHISSRLAYDPATGVMTWRNGRMAGKAAGSLDSRGYLQVNLDRRMYLVHRLAWFLVNREWPNADIDHIDRVRTNNAIGNLRVATRRQNMANMLSRRVGLKGTFYKKANRKWEAAIRLDGRRKYLGLYSTEIEAHEAYAKALREAYGEFARVA